MKRRVALFGALLLSLLAAAASKPQSLEQMRAVADAAQGDECAKICTELAQRLVDESDKLFTAGDVTQGHALMDDAVKYARKGTDASLAIGKRQKNVEITLRKMSKRITDIKETLNVDDRPGIQKNVDDVEQMRSALLESMFGLAGKGKKK